MLVLVTIGSAQAQMEWNGSQSNSWINGLNWTPVGPPGMNDDVAIDTDDPNSVWINGWNVSAGGLDVGVNNTTGMWIFKAGTRSTNSVARIGRFVGSDGLVSVLGGSILDIGSNLFVGSAGEGFLYVSGGSAVSNNQGFVGLLEGSLGTVTVTGAGSAWNNAFDLWVAQTGTGIVTVADGAAVTSPSGFVALQPGSEGTVTVTGNGSDWTMTGEMTVGYRGHGALYVEDGADVSNAVGGIIGRDADSQGTVTVSGAGSAWNSGGSTSVGFAGHGMLTVESGGQVASPNAAIGWGWSATGEAVVTGAGSVWTVGGSLIVGFQGQSTGILSIDDGGVVNTAALARIGSSSGATGSVVLSGSGSTWNVGEELLVGEFSTGSLHIGQGASVIVGNEVVVPNPAPFSSGELFVDGTLSVGSGIFINGAGRLEGTGSLGGGAVTISGTVAPGSPVGTLSMGTLILESGAVLEFELDEPGGAGDQLFVDGPGDLTLDGVLDVSDLGGFGAGTDTLIHYSGVLTDNTLTVGSLPSGFTAAVETSAAGQINLVVAQAPNDVFADRFEGN